MSDWLFQESLTFGNPRSGVGLVTLWTYQKRYRHIDPSLYQVMGNLYSEDGVNYLARNLLAHPQIRTLVICGSDGILEDTEARQALLDWRVTDPMIPAQDVGWLRDQVRLTECEMPDLPDRLKAEGARLASAAPGHRQPKTFPFREVTSATFPSEVSGMRVLWSSIFDAWVDTLRLVLRFGVHEGKRKALLNLVSVIDGEDDRLPASLSRRRAEAYATKFLSPEKEPDVTYTYGERLRGWGAERIDLIEQAVAKLEADPHSTRSVLDLWDNRRDLASEEPPCLTQLTFNRLDGALCATGFYRSHDLFRAYFLNLYALRHLQREAAKRLGWRVGKLTTISAHAHLYEWDLAAAQRAVEGSGPPECRWDPRGNLALTRRDGRTIAILYSPDGQPVKEYQGSPARILHLLVEENALSQPAHYVYIAQELLRWS